MAAPNPCFITFKFLLHLYEDAELRYTFPCRSKEEALFLAKPWNANKLRHYTNRKRRATVKKINWPLNKNWLTRCLITCESSAKANRREQELWLLSVYPARLLREWFEGIRLELKKSDIHKHGGAGIWKVVFVNEFGANPDDIPF